MTAGEAYTPPTMSKRTTFVSVTVAAAALG